MAIKAVSTTGVNGVVLTNGDGNGQPAAGAGPDVGNVARKGITQANAPSSSASPLTGAAVPSMPAKPQADSFATKVSKLAKACGFSKQEVEEYIQEVQVGSKKVVCVWQIHTVPAHIKLEKFLEMQALSKNCVFLTESLLRDPAFEKQFVKDKHNKDDPGFIHGLEDRTSYTQTVLYTLFDSLMRGKVKVVLDAFKRHCAYDSTIRGLCEKLSAENNAVIKYADFQNSLCDNGMGALLMLPQLLQAFRELLEAGFEDAAPAVKSALQEYVESTCKAYQTQGFAADPTAFLKQIVCTKAFMDAWRIPRDLGYAARLPSLVDAAPHADIVVSLGLHHKAGVLAALSAGAVTESSDLKDNVKPESKKEGKGA